MAERPHAIPAVVAALMLFIALGAHPYGYYTALRWVVAASAVFVAVVAWQSAMQWVMWPFAGVVILFNPLAPIYMSRESWRPIDVLCGLCFIGAALGVRAHVDRAAS